MSVKYPCNTLLRTPDAPFLRFQKRRMATGTYNLDVRTTHQRVWSWLTTGSHSEEQIDDLCEAMNLDPVTKRKSRESAGEHQP